MGRRRRPPSPGRCHRNRTGPGIFGRSFSRLALLSQPPQQLRRMAWPISHGDKRDGPCPRVRAGAEDVRVDQYVRRVPVPPLPRLAWKCAMAFLILAWFSGLRASWMTFAATPDASSFRSIPAMTASLLVGLSLSVPGPGVAQPLGRDRHPADAPVVYLFANGRWTPDGSLW